MSSGRFNHQVKSNVINNVDTITVLFVAFSNQCEWSDDSLTRVPETETLFLYQWIPAKSAVTAVFSRLQNPILFIVIIVYTI